MKLKKLSILSILFGISISLLFWQGCKVVKAVYETVQEAHFAASGHADKGAEAFVHWNGDNPPVVPVTCAKCHSINGFLDFAADGVVNTAAAPGVFTCQLCHTDEKNGITRVFETVTFPSGDIIGNLGKEAICMQCHQGRSSTVTVNTNTAGMADDTPNAKISFSNIHYFAAAATMYGTLVRGGYQYANKTYDAKFAHIEGYGACNDCHEPHSLEIRTERCDTCHTNVRGEADLKNIRFLGSLTDYDGDGNMTEGIYYEVQGILEKLYAGIQAYANQVVGVPIGYDGNTHPYFFKDTNGDGVIDASEAVFGNRYASFTPRLLKACYNMQVVKKDPGGFAHGGKYLIELMYDSIEDLNSRIGGAVSMTGMHRGDEGHFDGSGMPWRDWDAEGEVPANCARCHSAKGLPYFLANSGQSIAQPIANGLLCTTCHTSPPAVRQVAEVTFPSGIKADLGDSSNLCMICHQGRSSKVNVDKAIAASAGPYSFSNIHYFPAAAVFLGAEVKGGYEYNGKIYAGKNPFPNHMGKFNTCVQCHMGREAIKGHNVAEPNPANCVNCHGQDIAQPNPGADPALFVFEGIRPASIPDFDGDGNMAESIKEEIEALQAGLYTGMQAYGFAIGKPILYDPNSYPYFFKDTNSNGVIDPGEATYANGYKFDAAMLKAAFNLQMSYKEPHGHIHHPTYIAQLLVDSIQDVGGNVTVYTWR
ncbi:MAG: hypothetical protein QG657_5167 [Acidobacteriota bacterium]|nr:hypothetical protein [Acidobacteriota bacterium]